MSGFRKKPSRENITPFVLARDEVCYVGEAVAVVIAENRSIAEDAASRVEVDYEALAAVSDCRDAAQSTSAPVHRRVRSNVLAEYTIAYGDCESVFKHGEHVFSLSLKQHRGCAHPVEGRGVLASYDEVEERTTIWTSTQSPHEVRLSLVQLFEVHRKAACDHAGCRGRLGAKYLIYPEEVVVPLAARLLGRPVKWIEDRREHFLTSIEERDQYWDLQIAFNPQAESSPCAGRSSTIRAPTRCRA